MEYLSLWAKYSAGMHKLIQQLLPELDNYVHNQWCSNQVIDIAREILALCTRFQKISPPEDFILEHDLMAIAAYYYTLAARKIIVEIQQNGSIKSTLFIDYLKYGTYFRRLSAEYAHNRLSGIFM
ncbi:MAG: hypothetical protein NZM04_06705 [Methylacidiphilales bacterium]|nr:hypothetical protein [Candidatus Methylacidiphilales bacterium]